MNRLPDDTPLTLAKQADPPKVGPEIYILRLGADERLTFIAFSRALFGVWVHFDQHVKRSCPHYTDEARCPGCQDQLPKRWKGFVHCHCVEKRQDVFLELTPASANSLMQQLATGETLRGKQFSCQRTKGKNGRLLVRLLGSHHALQELPEELDPEKSLKALWGIQDKPVGGREFPRSPSRNGSFSR